MHTAWVAEKARLPTALPDFEDTGKDAAQALLGKACATRQIWGDAGVFLGWKKADLDAVKRAVAAGADPNKRAYYPSGKMGERRVRVRISSTLGTLTPLVETWSVLLRRGSTSSAPFPR